MTYLEAKMIAQKILDEEFDEEFNIMIDERYSVEFSRGWLFSYNTEEFIKDPSSYHYLVTTEPIIVDKIDSTVSRMSDCNLRFAGAKELIETYLKSKEPNNTLNNESSGTSNLTDKTL